jgi:hypothetical protein
MKGRLKCWNCKRWFEQKISCKKCGWFICPFCNSCGCNFKERDLTCKRVYGQDYYYDEEGRYIKL